MSENLPAVLQILKEFPVTEECEMMQKAIVDFENFGKQTSMSKPLSAVTERTSISHFCNRQSHLLEMRKLLPNASEQAVTEHTAYLDDTECSCFVYVPLIRTLMVN
jgi:hypothetical protein